MFSIDAENQICACQVTGRNAGRLIFPVFLFPRSVTASATFTLAVSHGGHTPAGGRGHFLSAEGVADFTRAMVDRASEHFVMTITEFVSL